MLFFFRSRREKEGESEKRKVSDGKISLQKAMFVAIKKRGPIWLSLGKRFTGIKTSCVLVLRFITTILRETKRVFLKSLADFNFQHRPKQVQDSVLARIKVGIGNWVQSIAARLIKLEIMEGFCCSLKVEFLTSNTGYHTDS